MKKIVTGLILFIYALGTFVYAKDLTSAHYIVRDPSIGTGGGFQSSGSFKMYSAGNLNISGNGGASASYIGRDGFLQYPVANASPLVAAVTGSQIDVSWTATYVADGYHVSGYKLGKATVSGGPYTFTSVGNVLNYSYTNQTPGDYYFILQTLDTFGNIIATSNEATVTVQESLSFALSANAVSFGSLTTAGPRYATTTGGSSSVAVAHTISASSNGANGYNILYNGSTLTSGANTIAPATIAGSATGSAGTNQFALSLLSDGTASVPTTYDQAVSNWKFAQNTLTTIATTSGPTALATLNAYYIANASTLAPAGVYNTALTYEVTANY